MAKQLGKEELRQVYRHVFLPPQLPQDADDSSDRDRNLICVTLNALEKLADNTNDAICNAIAAIKNLKDINSLAEAAASESQLAQVLTGLAEGRSAPVHVSSQNAAVLFTRKQDQLVVEAFELSPSSSKVIETKGRLVRTFPGTAVSVNTVSHQYHDFAPAIARTLSTMCMEPVSGMQPESYKAGGTHDELRDTTSPAVVTELFIGFLKGFGSPVKVSAISKATRDEVLWSNAKIPWRRSSMWLLIRVVLHLVITRSPGGSTGVFKQIMVYIMSQILDSARQHAFSCESLYAMNAKIVRRLHKLHATHTSGDYLNNQLLAEIQGVLQKTSDNTSTRWQTTQQENRQLLDLGVLAKLNVDRDTLVQLPLLDEYISSVQSRQSAAASNSFTPSSSLIRNVPTCLPTLPSGGQEAFHYAAANLQQFELWVAQHLETWSLSQTQPVSHVCRQLQELMQQYHVLAAAHYVGNPEGVSTMILTMYDLWVACDILAIKKCPMLAEYDPEISLEALQTLLLPFPYQMNRLLKLETYFESRSSNSRNDLENQMFRISSEDSFAARFFDGSDLHQRLRSNIKQEAGRLRDRKTKEFEDMELEYDTLTSQYDAIECDYIVTYDNWCKPPEAFKEHSNRCTKCYLFRKRRRLQIIVHEWPLPDNNVMAKTVVFELDVPQWYTSWRDARLFLLHDVLKGKRDLANLHTKYVLSEDPHLKFQYTKGTGQRRIGLLSHTKPMIVTHFKPKKINLVTLDNVCVASGLNYRYFDSVSGSYVGPLRFDDTTPKACTYVLPTAELRPYIFRPARFPDGESPNAVMASQDNCPANMSLEEFKELSGVPHGHHTQWVNVLQQLAMPGVDFKKLETTLVFLQCINQAGPPNGNYYREAHAFLCSSKAARDLIHQLDSAVNRVKQNWESAQALGLFASIATRVLFLQHSTYDLCLPLLAKIREVTFGWMQSLREAAHATAHHESRSMFISKSVEVALICASTFEVPKKYTKTVLGQFENVSMLVQATIAVQQGGTVELWKSSILQLMRLRFARYLHRAHKLIVNEREGIDDAIRQTWSSYRPGTDGWTEVSSTASDWITTVTSGTPMYVHYNLLSGELLVNGVPLDQPPQEYRSLPLYNTLFGNAVVEVLPATGTGFRYSTKRSFGGHGVQLGLQTTAGVNELIVQGEHTTGKIEYVPCRVFSGCFPSHFIDEYVHWYSFETGDVELRPVQDPWNQSAAGEWTLRKTAGEKWQLSKEGNAVVGLQTKSSKAIASVLRPLATPHRTHCVLKPSDRILSVDIPTLNLKFHLGQGETTLKSKEFPSMAVDDDQGLETLVGFSNRLMLKSEAGERLMLLPEASVVYDSHDEHVSVRILAVDSISQVHAIHIDQQLGRLVDSGDIGCKLYLAYLHALTSFCLPDSLIHTTGTEQALAILSSCAVRSFSQLSQENIRTLSLIAELSPGRSYYPPGKTVMQTVKWNKRLGFLAQHANLRNSVQAILDQARDAMIFEPDLKLAFPTLQHCDDHLQQRDSIRASTFRVSGFGAEDHSTQHDRAYSSRDRGHSCLRANNSSIMSSLVLRAGTDLHLPAVSLEPLWKKLCSVGIIEGPETSLANCRHRYDGVLTEKKNFSRVLAKIPPHLRQLAQDTTPQDRYSVAIWLASMAFADDPDMEILQMLAMFFKTPGLATSVAPSADTFALGHGLNRSEREMTTIVTSCAREFDSCPESSTETTERLENERLAVYEARCQKLWKSAKSSAVARVVAGLVDQWMMRSPTTPDVEGASTYIDMENAMAQVKPKIQAWHDNNLLHEHLNLVLEPYSGLDIVPFAPPTLFGLNGLIRLSIPGHFTMQNLFSVPAPQFASFPCPPCLPQHPTDTEKNHVAKESLHLSLLVESLETSAGSSSYEQSYVTDLKDSVNALQTQDDEYPLDQNLSLEDLMEYQGACRDYVREVYGQLHHSITQLSNSNNEQTAQQFPRVSAMLFLQQLAHDRVDQLPPAWKTSIVRYGVSLTALQRAERLVQLARSAQRVDLLNEYRNSGHQNWSPEDHPQSLLMEIESGIMIREVQEQVAAEMRSPSSGSNAVMQLNMGEGKSTVIIPMVAAALSDGHQLVRIIVAKPQSKQMAQMLIAKLGGLVKRRVYYLPFSRSLKLNSAAVEAMSRTLKDCMRSRGILLVQPEHILSFRLMAPECYITGNHAVGPPLMDIQDFFDKRARDIVDESDENFSVRFELIYTMGMQQIIELSPDRWLLMQQVLNVVMHVASDVAGEVGSAIELQFNGAGAFPRLRLLHTSATNALLLKVAAHIRDNGFEGFQIARHSQDMRDAVFEYITEFEPSSEIVTLVEAGEFWATCKAQILLLRGILAGGVLTFALGQKRWRVNYGLASRFPASKLAVPYRAKDNPTPRSEFSHPDVVIALTSLCYYYGGLSDDDMFIAFGHLVDSDQADAEYQTWVNNAPDLPAAFHQLQGINLKDRLQCILHLFPHLQKGKIVVDYFLSHIVFPKETKQFPHKLSVSGWDIGKRRQGLTTGFSGTNDSKRLLPMSIAQRDLEAQKHTNALVLEHLLQPSNGVELMNLDQTQGQVLDAERLLSTILRLDPPVQVILDVGAQILEYDNLGLAREWLRLSDSSKEAVVFVDDSDELCVVGRKGRPELLQTSPYASRLDACLDFLDESHTRGIDLKLPPDYRAAVTLGAHLTKDRLVQACMRMRKLGQGQSVVFCISQEIQAKIHENMLSYSASNDVTVADVLLWSISETHAEMRRSMPLWAVQGERFVQQTHIWKSMQNDDGKTSLSKIGAEKLLEEEAQSLEYRYRPKQMDKYSSRLAGSTDAALKRIHNRCLQFDGLVFNASTLQEEQERELSPEIEQERQVQKAPSATPAPHNLHKDVLEFARSGRIATKSDAYIPAFESLENTSASKKIPALSQLTGKGDLLVTADFAKAVKQVGHSFQPDAFQRQVHWVLTRRTDGSDAVNCIMVVSDYEANLLLPRMESTTVILHKYKARCNAGYDSLDKLDFFTTSPSASLPAIPRSLSVQLGLFAGQLYISSYEDYLEICKFLGLSAEIVTRNMEKQGWRVATDGFILKDERGRIGGTSGLTKSPTRFFKVLMSKIRRNGDGISKTHMGQLLDGKLFRESEWKV